MARNSKVIIAKNIKLDRNYTNVVNYTEQQMLDLINANGNKVAESLNCSFIKTSGTICTPFSYSQCLQSNYMAFQNPDYDNKWFFAWIDEVIYKSNGTGELKFTIDIFSTWFSKLTINPVNVIREHVNDDTIGLHTIPEGLDTGDFIINSGEYYDELDDMKYVIHVTEWSTTDVNPPLATNFGGVYMAGGAYVCDNITEVVTILQQYANRGKLSAVYNVYMIPSIMIDTAEQSLQYPGQSSPNTDTIEINKPSSFNSYTPVNKKLLTYPYNYLLVSNNNGSSNVYHFERFNGDDCEFIIKGVPVVRWKY